jgi:hypothetical protein
MFGMGGAAAAFFRPVAVAALDSRDEDVVAALADAASLAWGSGRHLYLIVPPSAAA